MSDENNDSILIDFLKEKSKREEEEKANREEEIDWITSHNRNRKEIVEDNPFVLMIEYIERVQLAERMMNRRLKMFHSLFRANIAVLLLVSALTCANFIFFIMGM